MLVSGAEWQAVCTCLESIPIQPEAEVTSKSNKENILPMMIAAVSYTHLDVYKRQIQYQCLTYTLPTSLALPLSLQHPGK